MMDFDLDTKKKLENDSDYRIASPRRILFLVLLFLFFIIKFTLKRFDYVSYFLTGFLAGDDRATLNRKAQKASRYSSRILTFQDARI